MVERSDRMWSTGEGNGKPLQYSCLENSMNSMKRQNDRILKEELPRSIGAQYATGDKWRNNSRKNEGMVPKQKQYPAVDMTGDRSKVRCCETAVLNMPANLENSAVATGLEKVNFHSNPKERQCQRMFNLWHNCTHFTC